ncbi:MAG TPA: TrkA family potassium uptake protein [Anaerolineaceae bacterium]|nr:TrkA family potassium uptake protein [Anaerolineaceae bacterium]HOV05705.1 TrkA family potassium uptake protein [Anaerolineaceae bacterium]
MFIVIAGGGRTGAQLAKSLIAIDHKVRVVEQRKEILSRIHKEIPTESIITGNPLDVKVLELADIKNAQVFAATTPNDAENLALCYLVRERYKVKRIIARVNNPRNAWLFDEFFNVDVAVNQADILAHLIEEEISMGDMMTLMKLRRGKYSIVEEKVPQNARAIGKAIKDLNLPANCVIAGIIRDGELMIPRGVTTLLADDEVLAITDHEGARKIAELLEEA